MDCREKIIQQRKFFDSGITRNIEWRKQKLIALYKAIKNYETEIFDLPALRQYRGNDPG